MWHSNQPVGCWNPFLFYFFLRSFHLIAYTQDPLHRKGCRVWISQPSETQISPLLWLCFFFISEQSIIMDDGNGQVTFMFQVGLVRDFISTDASQLTLKTLKDLACNFINQRVSDSDPTATQTLIQLPRPYITVPDIALIVVVTEEAFSNLLFWLCTFRCGAKQPWWGFAFVF